jgi:hypothetical protein
VFRRPDIGTRYVYIVPVSEEKRKEERSRESTALYDVEIEHFLQMELPEKGRRLIHRRRFIL